MGAADGKDRLQGSLAASSLSGANRLRYTCEPRAGREHRDQTWLTLLRSQMCLRSIKPFHKCQIPNRSWACPQKALRVNHPRAAQLPKLCFWLRPTYYLLWKERTKILSLSTCQNHLGVPCQNTNHWAPPSAFLIWQVSGKLRTGISNHFLGRPLMRRRGPLFENPWE